VTTTDAGGPLEVVADRRTGLVCEPRGAALAEACALHPGNVVYRLRALWLALRGRE